MRLICPLSEAEYFYAKGWMTQISLIHLRKSAFWRSDLSAEAWAKAEAIHGAACGEVDCFRLRSLSYGGQVAALAMTVVAAGSRPLPAL
jgi:hypothetical protein